MNVPYAARHLGSLYGNRIDLTQIKTPLQALPRLSAHLGGPTILMKRDDVHPLGLGGNKVRKLEYHLGAALAAGATDVITIGALQSNHARLTAAACATVGLACHLLLKASVRRDASCYEDNGNLILDNLLGATVVRLGEDADGAAEMERYASRLRSEERVPWIVPMGGSDALGSMGYVAAADEILQQLATYRTAPGAIVVASGSGGTHAGLLAGLHAKGFKGTVEGVCVFEGASGQIPKVSRLANEVLQRMGCSSPLPAAAIRCDDSQLGASYGQPTAAMQEAVRLCAKREGIFLDPVYSGKAMAWLIANIHRWPADETVVFIHTGGTPALFAYQDIW